MGTFNAVGFPAVPALEVPANDDRERTKTAARRKSRLKILFIQLHFLYYDYERGTTIPSDLIVHFYRRTGCEQRHNVTMKSLPKSFKYSNVSPGRLFPAAV